MNLPKFIYEDKPLFLGLIADLFPNMDIKRKEYENKGKITNVMIKDRLKPIDKMIDKVI